VAAAILSRRKLDVHVLELFLCKRFVVASHWDKLMSWLGGSDYPIKPPSSYGSFGTLAKLCDTAKARRQILLTCVKGENLYRKDLLARETSYIFPHIKPSYWLFLETLNLAKLQGGDRLIHGTMQPTIFDTNSTLIRREFDINRVICTTTAPDNQQNLILIRH